MSENLFEISSLLQGKDREKDLLDRKIHTLRAAIASQEFRLANEIEQHQKSLVDQKSLLKKIKEKNTYVEAFSMGVFQEEENKNKSQVRRCEVRVRHSTFIITGILKY